MRTITADELKSLMEENPDLCLVNVLPRDSFDQKHIPHSVSVPFDDDSDEADFVERVKEHASDESAPVVVYCADAACNLSPRAAQLLENAGYSNVMDFQGGVEEWESSGNEIESASSS